MNDDQTTNDVRVLRAQLTEIAWTMPDDPARGGRVLCGVRRHDRRRQAARISLGAVAAAGVTSMLVVVSTRGSSGGLDVGNTPSPDPSVATTETAPPTTPPPSSVDETKPGSPDVTCDGAGQDDTPSADDAAKAAADAATNGPIPMGIPGIKGYATVVAAAETSITLRFDAPPPGEPAEVTATNDPSIQYFDGDVPQPTRPVIAAGDRVAAGLVKTDTGYGLLFLQVHVPAPPESSDITPEEKMRNEAALEQHATLQEHAAKSAACTGG